MRESNAILRRCVHCGVCTATCPTYQILGDELDSPRGRIYLIKDMFENDRPADDAVVKHIDRCLSCLSCMSTCPSGVDYMHLVDHAREHIEKTYKRPVLDRALRWVLETVLPHPARFRSALLLARLSKPLASILPRSRLKAMLELAPDRIPPVSPCDTPQVFAADGRRRRRVALLRGCAQRALNTDINESTIRLLRRLGCEVVITKGTGCCGALTHHMGRTKSSQSYALRNIEAWIQEMESGLDAIVVNASGCGTMLKDYGHLMQRTSRAGEAAQVARLAVDITELLKRLEPARLPANGVRVAYHAACSLQHGQRIRFLPKNLLARAGYTVCEPADSHLCCGSAGTYNILQPELSRKLRNRKLNNLHATEADIIATGNIGCMVQLSSASTVPVVHTVELLDWAYGGPRPAALSGTRLRIGDHALCS